MENQQKEDKKKIKNEYDYNTIMMRNLFHEWGSFEDEDNNDDDKKYELFRV